MSPWPSATPIQSFSCSRSISSCREQIWDAGGDEIAVFSIGESSLAVFPLGHPYLDGFDKPGVHHIALAAKDLSAAVKQAEDARAATLSGERHCLGGGTRIAIDSNHTASVRTWICQSFELPRSQSSHVERIDHLGIASADNRTAVEAWCTRLKRPLESQQTDMEVSIAVESFTSDKYGVVISYARAGAGRWIARGFHHSR